jgi:hypothetical protein
MSGFSGMQAERIENHTFGSLQYTVGVGHDEHRANFSAFSSLPGNLNGQDYDALQGFKVESLSSLTDLGDDILFSSLCHLYSKNKSFYWDIILIATVEQSNLEYLYPKVTLNKTDKNISQSG